jgi:hypothetical protein
VSPERLLRLLADLACYPHAPTRVRIVQTHLSIVAIADDLVYKLKKPLRLPFVDFSSLALRRAACRQEVALNRRLCDDVYLGTTALRSHGQDVRFAALGDDCGPDDVEVAVVMKRLPQERMLDELLAHDAVAPGQLVAVAERLARFHATADRSPNTRELGKPERLVAFAAANFDELAAMGAADATDQPPDHGLPTQLLDAVRDAQAAAFARLLPTLQRRALAGRVCDGHGDLHARNICLTNPPTIYDCIEFNPALRCGDVVAEVAFLAMDLRYRGRRDLGDAFVTAYADAARDPELPTLLAAPIAYRAMVRAKVAALAAREPELPAADRAAAATSARAHLRLAAATLATAEGPWWIVVCGPPAAGKSRLAHALAAIAGWPHLATDVVRKQLAGIVPTERAAAEHYSAEFSAHTYAELHRLAERATRAGADAVLLDGNYAAPAQRAEAAAAAHAVDARLLVLHLHVDRKLAASRAEHRRTDPTNVSDADPQVLAALHDRFVVPHDGEADRLIHLDGTCDTEALVDRVLAFR